MTVPTIQFGQPAPAVGSNYLRDMHRAYGTTPRQYCRTCTFLQRIERGTRWMKCAKSHSTSSSATDWRAGWPACGLYQENTP